VLLAKNLLDSRKLNIVPEKLLNAFSLRASRSYPVLAAVDVSFFFILFFHFSDLVFRTMLILCDKCVVFTFCMTFKLFVTYMACN